MAQNEKPSLLPAGSAGYAPKYLTSGVWQKADRFAGAILLGEILSWCSEEVRNKKWTDASYFKTEEMQTECERYTLLQQVLHNQWNGKLQNYLSRHGVVILSQNAQALHSGTMYFIAREKE